MSRPDLLALSPESIAALANLGLVKRAQREIAAGEGPTLEEDAAGTVTGSFKDGVIARLVPGRSLRDTPCSCGAVTVCRHRVAVALAYPAWHAQRAPDSASAARIEPPPPESTAHSKDAPGADAPRPRESTAQQEPAPPTYARADPLSDPWSPGELTDEELERAVGKRIMTRARALSASGLVVEIRRPAPDREDRVFEARLPTCAVRFLVPRDLAYARCDCALALRCEHVVLAAWAFRDATEIGPTSTPRMIELSARHADPAGVAIAVPARVSALDGALDLAREVLLEGVAGVRSEHLAPRFARARAELAHAGLVWPTAIVDELEASLEAYRDRSARYSAAHVASLLTELAARVRASARGGELPARFVLGEGEARETLLDHVRLLSLGARVEADGRARTAAIYLADASTGVVLVLSKRWSFSEDEEPEDGPALRRRAVASGLTLGALAAGQLVSRAVKRLANRSVVLGASRKGQTSITPQSGDWSFLPASILVRDFEAHALALRALPPRLLRPRVLAETTRALAVAEVGEIVYRPGEQELCAELHDASGAMILLRRRHRRAAPHAIEAIAHALRGDPPVRFVSGEIRRGLASLEIDPAALVTDRVIVPDLEPEVPLTAPLPAVAWAAPASPLHAAVERALSSLEEGCHVGLLGTRPEWAARAREAAERLHEAGLDEVARRMRMLVQRVREAQENGSLSAAGVADAWLDASIRAALVGEAL